MNYKRCIEKKSELYGYCKRCVGKQMKDELEELKVKIISLSVKTDKDNQNRNEL